jgi:tetratricopeptide (TPR) repeat protein/predicted Ser/Thr protein kinase
MTDGDDHRATAESPRIGRFPILRVLGRGGMGVVYSAFDEELGRRVAIKLLRATDEHVSEGRIRMLREAQAMARLSHPNVAHIYEVGETDGQVYIAMEYIQGETLRAWTKRQPRTWREVVAMYLQAGRGLAAAHAAGLIHRDFKPDNVLVGDDGRARVVDFGLARAHEGGPAPDLASTGEFAAPVDGASSLDVALTEVGTVLGTLAYMAPEQHRGEPADARSDQFAFCVALWEGLYGQRPFAGRTSDALAAEMEMGVLREPPRVRVPAAVHALLRRGLAPHPRDRWPSMDALLAVLAVDPAARQRRRVAVAAAATALVGLAAGVVHARVIDGRRCLGRADEVAAIWSDERREAVRSAISSTGTSYAAELATRVTAGLDDYTRAWLGVATEACESHRTGAQSDEYHAVREVCLAERLVEVRALVDALAGADATVFDNAAVAVQRLTDVRQCADRQALMTRVDPPDIVGRITAARLRGRLTRAEAAEWVGRYDDGLAIAAHAAGEARALGHAPLLAEALFTTGTLHHSAGAYRDAELALDEAWRVAVTSRHDVVAAGAGALLVYVVGYEQGRYDEALRWVAPHALAAADRLGEPGLIHSVLFNAIGATLDDRDEFEPARRYYERALDILERQFGPEHPKIAPILTNLALVVQDQGHFDEAERLFRRALALSARRRWPSNASEMAGRSPLSASGCSQADVFATMERAAATGMSSRR